MITTVSFHSNGSRQISPPIPNHLKYLMSSPTTPWSVSPLLQERMKQTPQIPNKLYCRVNVLETDPEYLFVSAYFNQHKPPGTRISSVDYIYNSSLTKTFKGHLAPMEAQANRVTFVPPHKRTVVDEQRETVLHRWRNLTDPFSNYQLKVNGQMRDITMVKIIPLWHGTKKERIDGILEAGFTFFGKHDLKAGKFSGGQSTDLGYFGSGIFFTDSARYASMYSSDRQLLLSLVSCREPYPVISDLPYDEPHEPKEVTKSESSGSLSFFSKFFTSEEKEAVVPSSTPPKKKPGDIEKLEGDGAYSNYNAHFAPVVSTRPSVFHCKEYFPCRQGEEPAWDELVVFQSVQVLPQFCVSFIPIPDEELPPYTQEGSIQAAKEGILHFFEKLPQEYRSLLNTRGPNNETLLYLAAEEGQLAVIDYLDQQHPELIDQQTTFGATPLYAAFTSRNRGVIEWVYQKRPNFLTAQTEEGWTLLHLVAHLGYEEGLLFLMRKNSTLTNTVSKDLWTPLHIAILHQQEEIALLLINQKADLFALTIHKENVFHLCAKYKCTKVLKELVQKSKSLTKLAKTVNQKNEGGLTPLDIALQPDSPLKMIQYFLEMVIKSNQSPSAVQASPLNTIEWFETQISTPLNNNTQTTLLHLAVKAHHLPALQWIFEKNAQLLAQIETSEQISLSAATDRNHLPAMAMPLKIEQVRIELEKYKSFGNIDLRSSSTTKALSLSSSEELVLGGKLDDLKPIAAQAAEVAKAEQEDVLLSHIIRKKPKTSNDTVQVSSDPLGSMQAHYRVRHSVISLPMTDQTFPVAGLYTELALVSQTDRNELEIAPLDLKEMGIDQFRDYIKRDWERLLKVERPIELDQLFSTGDDQPIHHVLLTGAPGSGKSTLCQKIAYTWASGLLFQDRFKAVFWIPLRILNKAVAPGGELHEIKDPNHFLAVTMAKLILEQEDLVESLLKVLKTHRQEILVLLDGYDEASDELCQMVARLRADTELHLLLTSRSGATEYIQDQMDRTVENLGFADKHVKSYCQGFFSRNGNTALSVKKHTAFFDALRAHPYLFQIAHIPLQLQMLCCLWEQGAYQIGFGACATQLYTQMCEQLFSWHCRRQCKDPFKVSAAEKANLFALLGEIAEYGLSKDRLMVPRLELLPYLDVRNLTTQNLIDSGFLKAAGTELNAHYYFVHLTFQEYLLARRISLSSTVEQEGFVFKYRNLSQFQPTIAFLAGLLSRQPEGLEKGKCFFRWLHQGAGVDMIGNHQLRLTLRCLGECEDPALHKWVEDTYKSKKSLLEAMRTHFSEIDFYWSFLPTGTRSLHWTPFFDEILQILLDLCPGQAALRNQPRLPLGQRFTPIQMIVKVAKVASADKVLEIISALLQEQRYNTAYFPEFIASNLHSGDIARFGSNNVVGKLLELEKQLETKQEWVGDHIDNAIKAVIRQASPEQIPQIVLKLSGSLTSWDKQVCRSAVSAFEEVAKVCTPELICKIVPILCTNKCLQYSKEAVGVIRAVAKIASPNLMPQITSALMQLLRQGNASSNIAIDVIGEVTKVVSAQEIFSIVKDLIKVQKDEIELICDGDNEDKEGYRSAGQGYTSFPPSLSVVQARLKQVNAKRKAKIDRRKKYSASGALWKVAQAASGEQIPQVLSALLHELDDGVSHYVAYALGEVAQAASAQEFSQILGVLKKAVTRGNTDSQPFVLETYAAIAKVAKLASTDQMIVILEVLSQTQSKYAASTLEEVTKLISTEQIYQIPTILIQASDRRDITAYRSALCAITEIAKLASPEQISQNILPALMTAWNSQFCSPLFAVEALAEVARFASADEIAQIAASLVTRLREDREMPIYLAKVTKVISPKQASQILVTVMGNLEDCGIHSALELIMELAKVVLKETPLEQISKILDFVKLALAEKKWSLDHNTVIPLKEFCVMVSSTSPESSPEIFAILKQAMEDGDGSVHEVIFQAFAEIAKKASSDLFSQILSVFSQALKNTCSSVQDCAVNGFKELAMIASSDHLSQILEILNPELNDQNEKTSSSAAQALGEVVAVASSTHLSQILETLSQAMLDERVFVRIGQILLKAAKIVSTDKVFQIGQIVGRGLQSLRQDVREFAVDALAEELKLALPDHLSPILSILGQTLSDRDGVKFVSSYVAERALVKVAEMISIEEVPTISQVIVSGLKHRDEFIRKSSITALEKVTKVASTEQVLDIAKVLIQMISINEVPTISQVIVSGLKHRDEFIRKSSITALEQMTKVASTEQVLGIANVLIQWTKHNAPNVQDNMETEVRRFIAGILKTIPLPQYLALLVTLDRDSILDEIAELVFYTNGPLYLKRSDSDDWYLCCIWNNQECEYLIPEDTLRLIRGKWFNLPLKSYTTQYFTEFE